MSLIDKIHTMRKLFILVSLFLLLASCSAQLTEKVVETYPNGNTLKSQFFDRKGDCVKEVEFYSTGAVKMEGAMKGEKREGEWKAYFPDGRMQSHGFFKDGLRSGVATVWQENGNLLQEGFYKEGKHCGKWKFYDEQGDIVREIDFGE